jgi:hypothetical protein
MPTYKSTTKFQQHAYPNYNTATATILDLWHPAFKRQLCQHYILLLKAPKARATGRQSMDHTCNMIQMIETMKGIFWSVKKNGDMSIATGAFADMDRLPDFHEMLADPVLLVPQKFPVDEDAILPYFTNLVEAVPSEFNVTSFVIAHNIPFHEFQACFALHIWPHSIKISPDQSDPYDIPNDMFCNSQILSQNCMLKLTKEDNDASLLAIENRLFDRLFDAMQDQSQATYAFIGRHVHHLSTYCDNAQPMHNIITYSSSTPPRLNKPTIQETPYSDKISSTSPNSNRPTIQENPYGDIPTIQETPDDDEISVTPPCVNALPIQETPEDDEILVLKIRFSYHVSYFESTNLI